MKAIVCVSPDWGIGDGGGLLYRLPGDLKYFKEQTAGHTVIMGRKTLESLPGGKPLPKRRNIVLTRDRRFARPGVYVCHDLRELQELLAALGEEDPFVIGGGEVYQTLLPYCSSCLVTRVKEKPEIKSTVFFPNLKSLGWKEKKKSALQKENGLSYRFTEWVRE
ncbi:MAG: dihydrofolate reductase [Lachnospiraceae bacterium]|nr:dihydrofolate reductase [Lachnospiraceae bacterium]